MRNYFYAENEQKFGPFTIDELKTKRLKKSTLVWTEGMLNWACAYEIEELRSILIVEPPPLPPTEPEIESTKYDPTYQKELEATIFGILLLVIPLVITLTGAINIDNEGSYNKARMFATIGSIIFRITATIWVANIASNQNRNATNWGCFAFILPSIALIIIGQLKKLKLKIVLDRNLPVKNQVAFLFEKAETLFSDRRYPECIQILNKIIEIESNNYDCIKMRGISNFKMKNYNDAKTDFETLIKVTKYSSIANLYLGNLAITDKNREIAIDYWLKSAEQKNETAKLNLDLYSTFTNNYLLDKSQVSKKLTDRYILYFIDGRYLGGIDQIDNTEVLSKLITEIRGYGNGLEIELRKNFKPYHICIAYYEIKDILYNQVSNLFELHLTDSIILKFNYNQAKDSNLGLKILCDKFQLATGKIPTASTLWNE